MRKISASSKPAARKASPKVAAVPDRNKKTPAQKTAVRASSSKRTESLVINTKTTLPKALQLQMLDLMIKSRVLEERLIKVYKTGDAYFWIGGAGEEAFGVALGLHVLKGRGPTYDFLHMHYRATPTLIAMGMNMKDSIRLMMNRSTDPSTGGRNFCNHYCIPEWNVVPVTSPIEVQYGMALGTAMAQRRRRDAGNPSKNAISIVTGGDAGTAEGDFASCLVWCNRPGFELPMLITVQNNKWGISTSYDTQHAEKNVVDRGKAFGIRTTIVNGNDPIESYLAIQTETEYIRRTGKPVLAEFAVSRLYGHSSATGANREADICPIEHFEKKLVDQRLITLDAVKNIWQNYDDESRKAADEVRLEPVPTRESVWDHIYANNENADWRKF